MNTMQYYDYLNLHKQKIMDDLETLFRKHKVEPIGNGYIDCIIQKNNLKAFINEISSLGIIINTCSWWCYVNPNDINTGCPHGMGGPKSDYYERWYSELENDFCSIDEDGLNTALNLFNKEFVYLFNMKMLDRINKMLKTPFRYTPTEFIDGNKCVTPGLWILVPDDWERN